MLSPRTQGQAMQHRNGTSIGKLVNNDERTKMCPNDTFTERIHDVTVHELRCKMIFLFVAGRRQCLPCPDAARAIPRDMHLEGALLSAL